MTRKVGVARQSREEKRACQAKQVIMGTTLVIAGAGIACLDYLVTAPQIPWGSTGRISGFAIRGGGLVATALVACARLGAECYLMSLLGGDGIAEQILDELRDENLDTGNVARVEGRTSPFSFVHVDELTGDRTIFHRSAADLDIDAAEVDAARISTCDVLIVDDVYPKLTLSAAQFARAQSIPVVADMIPQERNAGLLRHVDVLISPRHYLEQTGRENDPEAGLDAIHELGPQTAVVTLGSEGCVYSDQHGRGRVDAFEVDVVDTTGAGDAFHGAYAYALAKGWETGRCCEFASAVAAMKCRKPGGRTGLPDLEDTLCFLRERSGLEW